MEKLWKSLEMSDISSAVVQFAVLQYLETLKDSSECVDKDKVASAFSLLKEAFNLNTESVADNQVNSLFPMTLGELVNAGAKALDVEPYNQGLQHVSQNSKFGPFVETVSKKGYFAGADEGSLEYVKRNAKVIMKFKEKVSAKGGAQAEAAAEAKKMEGNAAITNKDFKGAVAAYTEAIELCPEGKNSHIYYTNRAAAYCYLKEYENAVKDCEKSILLDPLYVKAYSRLGLANFFLEKYEKAVDAYQRASDLEPDNKSHKDSLRQAKQKLDEVTNKSTPSSSSGAPSSSSAGGMPDFSALAQMMGGGDGAGLASLMKNPGTKITTDRWCVSFCVAVMQAAQEMMKNPQMMQQALSMLGGGAGGAGGMPDMAAMASMLQGMNAASADNHGKKGRR